MVIQVIYFCLKSCFSLLKNLSILFFKCFNIFETMYFFVICEIIFLISIVMPHFYFLIKLFVLSFFLLISLDRILSISVILSNNQLWDSFIDFLYFYLMNFHYNSYFFFVLLTLDLITSSSFSFSSSLRFRSWGLWYETFIYFLSEAFSGKKIPS